MFCRAEGMFSDMITDPSQDISKFEIELLEIEESMLSAYK